MCGSSNEIQRGCDRQKNGFVGVKLGIRDSRHIHDGFSAIISPEGNSFDNPLIRQSKLLEGNRVQQELRIGCL